jgi:hypothetical protein
MHFLSATNPIRSFSVLQFESFIGINMTCF